MKNYKCWKINALKTLSLRQWQNMLKLQVSVPNIFTKYGIIKS